MTRCGTKRCSPTPTCEQVGDPDKNRDRLLNNEVAQRFFAEVNRLAKRFRSDEHFTVDGTLIQAWASQKSFRPKHGSDDNDGTNFRGQKRSNDTHQSSTDPDARLYRKSYGKESKLVGADKAYDSEDFVATARQLNVTVPVQKNEKGRRSRIDRRTTRHSGYARSLSRRWLVEKTFGWL